MKMFKILGLASALVTPALAASDYLLEIEGIKGESKSTIEVNSWSWGASNPGSMSQGSGGGAGKASTSDLSVTTSTREAGSGMATGKRQHGLDANTQPTQARAGGVRVATGDVNGDGMPDVVTSFSFDVAPGSELCATGKHIKEAKLFVRKAGEKQQDYVFTDLMVTSCTGSKVTVTGSAKHTKTGHVTLMK